MAAVIFHEPIFATVVESGDKLYFYEVGTTTDLTVYTDFALSTPASQPVVADSNGRFVPLYIDATGNDPKVVLTDSSDVEKWTCERYPIEDITTLSADLATAQSDITTLQGDVTTAESDISTLQTESTDYESRISTIEALNIVEDGDFTTSAAANGYVKFPNGIYLQWGSATAPANSTSSNQNFPIAFPNNCWVMTTNRAIARPGSTDANTAGALIVDKTQYQVYNDDTTNVTVYWMAIGN